MWERLTPAEKSICALLIQGLSNEQIAATLNKAIKTVKGHLGRVYRKFGLAKYRGPMDSRVFIAVQLTYDRYPHLRPRPGLRTVPPSCEDGSRAYDQKSNIRPYEGFNYGPIILYSQPAENAVMREAMRSRSAFEPVRLLRESSDVQPGNGKRQDLCMDISAIASNEALGASLVK
jgi:regulatory LuxR family protein